MPEYKEFKLGTLLKKVETQKLKLSKGDCPVVPDEIYNLPARTAITTNQGLAVYVPKEGATICKNVISVAANGDFSAFWHDAEFTILQDSYALEGNNFELNKNIALYIISCMYKALSSKYNWNNKSGWAKIKDESILLPVQNTAAGYVPDFEYMEKYIEELEQERIEELEQYLVATGLNDYELTEEDLKILSLSLVSGITKNEIVKLLLRFAKSSS